MRTGVEAATAGDNLKRRVANPVLLGSVLIPLSVLLAHLPALRQLGPAAQACAAALRLDAHHADAKARLRTLTAPAAPPANPGF